MPNESDWEFFADQEHVKSLRDCGTCFAGDLEALNRRAWGSDVLDDLLEIF